MHLCNLTCDSGNPNTYHLEGSELLLFGVLVLAHIGLVGVVLLASSQPLEAEDLTVQRSNVVHACVGGYIFGDTKSNHWYTSWLRL